MSEVRVSHSELGTFTFEPPVKEGQDVRSVLVNMFRRVSNGGSVVALNYEMPEEGLSHIKFVSSEYMTARERQFSEGHQAPKVLGSLGCLGQMPADMADFFADRIPESEVTLHDTPNS